jgi:adenosylhomocysteine nucleosidase
MDTSPLGDPKGLISGINKVYFDTDSRAAEIVLAAAERLGIKARGGIVASGDKFVAQSADKDRIVADFSADVCEMEGAAVAHTAFVNGTAFLVVRAISDSADGGANMDYMEFLPIAAKNSASLTLELIKAW